MVDKVDGSGFMEEMLCRCGTGKKVLRKVMIPHAQEAWGLVR